MASPIKLATMGMFIIDTFQFIHHQTGKDLGNKGLPDQIGGGGCYFAIGARPFLLSWSIQMIVDRGCDWKDTDQAVLDRFNRTPSSSTGENGSMWRYRSRPDKTTRAVNTYTDKYRAFHYLSPKIRLEPKDLLQCSTLKPPKLPEWIHLICSPARALETVAQIEDILGKEQGEVKKNWPKLVFEPIPDSCEFDNLDSCIKVLPKLKVFSPNHEEAIALLGLQDEWEKLLDGRKKSLEKKIMTFIRDKVAAKFLHHLLNRDPEARERAMNRQPFGPIICIRCGARGSVIGTMFAPGWHHIPAWHTDVPPTHTSDPAANTRISSLAAESDCQAGSLELPEISSSKIKDVTGAGNSFLGGLTAYLAQTDAYTSLDQTARIREAAMHGSVSASLIIEQHGLPSFEVRDGKELWNGHTVEVRMRLLRQRVSMGSMKD
ncbi:hypothetical protein NDA18_003792 [Ustilago nuda]|nr:hypothetical protein NDA18_003792 [Ustilago nuda]